MALMRGKFPGISAEIESVAMCTENFMLVGVCMYNIIALIQNCNVQKSRDRLQERLFIYTNIMENITFCHNHGIVTPANPVPRKGSSERAR